MWRHLELSVLQASGIKDQAWSFGFWKNGCRGQSLKPALEAFVQADLLHYLVELIPGLSLFVLQVRDFLRQCV